MLTIQDNSDAQTSDAQTSDAHPTHSCGNDCLYLIGLVCGFGAMLTQGYQGILAGKAIVEKGCPKKGRLCDSTEWAPGSINSILVFIALVNILGKFLLVFFIWGGGEGFRAIPAVLQQAQEKLVAIYNDDNRMRSTLNVMQRSTCKGIVTGALKFGLKFSLVYACTVGFFSMTAIAYIPTGELMRVAGEIGENNDSQYKWFADLVESGRVKIFSLVSSLLFNLVVTINGVKEKGFFRMAPISLWQHLRGADEKDVFENPINADSRKCARLSLFVYSFLAPYGWSTFLFLAKTGTQALRDDSECLAVFDGLNPSYGSVSLLGVMLWTYMQFITLISVFPMLLDSYQGWQNPNAIEKFRNLCLAFLAFVLALIAAAAMMTQPLWAEEFQPSNPNITMFNNTKKDVAVTPWVSMIFSALASMQLEGPAYLISFFLIPHFLRKLAGCASSLTSCASSLTSGFLRRLAGCASTRCGDGAAQGGGGTEAPLLSSSF